MLVVQVDSIVKTDCVSTLLSVRTEHCVMLMNTVDVTDMASSFQHALLQLALPSSCRDGVIQQLCADPSAVSLVCLLVLSYSLDDVLGCSFKFSGLESVQFEIFVICIVSSPK